MKYDPLFDLDPKTIDKLKELLSSQHKNEESSSLNCSNQGCPFKLNHQERERELRLSASIGQELLIKHQLIKENYTQLQKQLNNLKSDLEQAFLENKQLRLKNNLVEEENEELRLQKQRLESKLAQMTSTESLHKKELNKIQSQLVFSESKEQSISKMLAELNLQHDTLKQKHQLLVGELKDTQGHLEKYEKEYDELSALISTPPQPHPVHISWIPDSAGAASSSSTPAASHLKTSSSPQAHSPLSDALEESDTLVLRLFHEKEALELQVTQLTQLLASTRDELAQASQPFAPSLTLEDEMAEDSELHRLCENAKKLYEQWQHTDPVKLNRQLKKSFHMHELHALSNTLLTQLQQAPLLPSAPTKFRPLIQLLHVWFNTLIELKRSMNDMALDYVEKMDQKMKQSISSPLLSMSSSDKRAWHGKRSMKQWAFAHWLTSSSLSIRSSLTSEEESAEEEKKRSLSRSRAASSPSSPSLSPNHHEEDSEDDDRNQNDTDWVTLWRNWIVEKVLW